MLFRFEEITGYEDLVRRKLIKTPKETRHVIEGREKQLVELSRDAFKDHEIMSSSPGRWIIAKKYPDGKWTGVYLAEIITCRIGVFVSGDIDSVIFAGGDSSDSARSRLNWVAHNSIGGYLAGKARMGFNSSTRNPAEEQDDDTAIAEMQSHVFDAYQSICEDVLAEDDNFNNDEIEEIDPPASFNSETGKIECDSKEHLAELLEKVDSGIKDSCEIQAWADAIESLVNGDALELIKNELYDDLNKVGISDVGEIIGDIGIVTAARVYYAQAACQKLSELLEAMDENNAKNEVGL